MLRFFQWIACSWERVGFLLSVYFMGVMILSLGPSFQEHVTALIVSSEASLYSSVYKAVVVNFPSLKDWLVAQPYTQFFIGSALLVLALSRSQTMRGAFILLSITGFGFWMALDTYYLVRYDNGGLGHYFECLVSNIFGSCIYAAMYVVVLSAAQKLRGATIEHPVLVSSVSIALPIIFGLLIVLSQYYILTLLFHAAPSNIEIRLGASSRFTYLIDEDVKKKLDELPNGCCEQVTEQNKEDQYFNVFGGRFAGQLEFNGLAENSLIEFNGSSENVYDVSITAYAGCISKEVGDFHIDERKSAKFSGLKNLTIEIDKGMVQLFSENKFGNLQTERANAGQVWLDKKDDLFEVTSFVTASTKVDYWVDSKSLVVNIRVPLIGDESGSVVPSDRRVVIQTDKSELGLDFLPLKGKRAPEACALLNFAKGKENYRVSTGAVLVNLILRITKPDTSVLFSSNKKDYLSFGGLDGWYAIKKISSQDFQDVIEEGLMQGLSFGGDVESFHINGKKVMDTEGRWYSAYKTKVVAKAQENGGLRISGTAENIWSDSKRLNKTRWESLDGATQTILLGLIGSLLLSFATAFWRCWTANDTYQI